MKNTIEINCTLSLTDYLVAVDSIANEYFDDQTGEYTPQYGFLNAMRVFYNMCVKTDLYDLSHDITDALDMEKLVVDEDFVDAFNRGMVGDGQFRFNFANAYMQAMDIVSNKNNSVRHTLNEILSQVLTELQSISNTMTTENIDKISKIADDIAKGNLSAEQIAEAYGNSKRFQDVTSGDA